jgi:uncharacterized protein YukE
MVASGQFELQPEAVRATVGNVGGVIMQTITVLMDLEKMIVPPTSFATIGGAVASANTAMQGQQVAALRSLLNLLQQVNNNVKQAADAYDSADQAVSSGFGGTSQSATTTTANGLWSTPVAAQLASIAVSNSMGATGQPNSAGTVLSYLTQAGLTHSPQNVPTTTPQAFTSWLDASPDNQASLGVIGVYSGAARGFTDVPGGVHNGDIVAIDPSGSNSMIGVIGNSNQLYNNGLLQPQFGDVATLRVYRPM